MTSIRVRRRTSTLTGAALALVALGVASSGATAAVPGTVQLQQVLNRSSVVTTTTTTSGRTLTSGLGMLDLKLTRAGEAGVTLRGFCDDPLVGISVGNVYNIQVQNASDDAALAGANYDAVAYLIRTVQSRVDAATDKGLEAGAHQLAVWQLAGRVLDTNPTTSAAMNARAAQLRLLALAATEQAPAASAGASACAGTGTVQVTVSGSPGAAATVAVASGSATASASRVVLDSTGHGTVYVTSQTAATSVLRITLDTGEVVRAARIPGVSGGPQQTVMVTDGTTVFNVPVQFTDCVAPSSTPVTPAVPVAPESAPAAAPKTEAPAATGPAPSTAPALQRAGFKLVKTGPKQVRAGQHIRFKLKVTNTGDTPLNSVTVTDPIPEGAYIPKNSATAKRLNNGAVVFTVPRLAPGASRVFWVELRPTSNTGGTVCNVARASASDGSSSAAAGGDVMLKDESTACTKVIGQRNPRILPAVTG